MEQIQIKEREAKINSTIILGIAILLFLLVIAYFSDKNTKRENTSSFGANKDFNVELFSDEHKRLIQKSIAEFLLTDIRNNPGLIYSLSPSEFEDFVALLLIKKGYDVEVTSRVKDGGKDIIAKYRMPTGNTIITYIECKKYNVDKKVGVHYIRALYGTIQADSINYGIVATSSSFTKGAKDFQLANRHHLCLADYSVLNTWLLS